ncbi:MAG: sensor histidine kinase, partial [Myxococcota bacterium]
NEWKYAADLTTELDPDLPEVTCLAAEINQVILNLIVNAAHSITDVLEDSSEEKGAITIRTRRVDDDVEIKICDTGGGIPESAQEHIFDPFFTTKEVGKGTGQGLAIARAVIVEKHGGGLDFESELGKGTTFRIRLPIEPRGEASAGSC